jgi:hypothetical protein
VGGGDAAGVWDCGWEAAEVADDSEQELRWSSGESSRAEEGKRGNAAGWNG